MSPKQMRKNKPDAGMSNCVLLYNIVNEVSLTSSNQYIKLKSRQYVAFGKNLKYCCMTTMYQEPSTVLQVSASQFCYKKGGKVQDILVHLWFIR